MVQQSDWTESIPPSTIESDLPCRQCGYNLRGLAVQSNCPECGRAIATSTGIRFLRDCGPPFARKLSRGAKAVITGMIFSAASPLVNWLGPGLMYNTRLSCALDGIDLAGSVLTLLGLWIITSPQSCLSDDWKRSWGRKLIRSAAIVIPVFKAALMTITYVDIQLLYRILNEPLPRTAFLIGVVLESAARSAGTFAALSYLGYLSWHIPRQRLVNGFRFLEAAFGIPFTVMVLVEATDLALTGVPYPDDARLSVILSWTTAIVRWPAGLFYLTYLALLYRFCRLTAAAAKDSMSRSS